MDGYDPQSSTELWDGETWRSDVRLPIPVYDHCLVKINSTHYFLTGGQFDIRNFSLLSFIFNGDEFVKVENLIRARSSSACGLHGDHLVFVAGGTDDDHDNTDGLPQKVSSSTSDYFSLKTMTWSEGRAVSRNEKSFKINHQKFIHIDSDI